MHGIPYISLNSIWGINFFDIFTWGNYSKFSKLYVMILTIFWGKNGELFKGGYYSREDTNKGNTVCTSINAGNQ